MRLALLVSVGLLAAAGSAQEPVPDPTPAHRYFPLAVGDVREYEECVLVFGVACWEYETTRQEITRDTLVSGVRYFVERTWGLDEAGFWTDLRETRLLRFDTTAAQGVRRLADGSEVPVTCRLDEPFHTTEDDGCGLLVSQPGPGLKSFDTSDSAMVYQVDVGYVWFYVWAYTDDLTYSFVGGVESGTPYPVAGERPPASTPLALSAYPNPTRGPLTLALAASPTSDVTLDVFDALGRSVWRESLHPGAEAGRVEVDASGWAPGLYVVRALADGAAATATVVRR